jgi:hypothetical protein
MKAMGTSKGFPDIIVTVPAGPFHGFFLEMKPVKGGNIQAEQAEWLNYLRGKGYYAEVARGFEAAKEMFLHYISLTKPMS